MIYSIRRAVILAVIGAVCGAASLVIAYARHPGLALEMDRDVPRVTSGFYPTERAGEETFAWTARSAALRLPGLDRRVPWQCMFRVRGGRGPGLEQPTVQLAADGITLVIRRVTNEYVDLEVEVPTRPARRGALLTLTSSVTVVPGPSDRRELGVSVDRITCRPAQGSVPLPPPAAVAGATVAGAAFAAALGMMGAGLAAGLIGTLVLASAQAFPLSFGPAPYLPYETRAAWTAVAVSLAIVFVAFVVERWARRPLRAAERFVLAFSGGALLLQLFALLHPMKPVVDAVFHAHRLEWVLDGRFYFTQPMPDGVQFPYAIALYVFAAPWSALTSDHVALLRVIVSSVHVAAGLLLYPMLVRAQGDRTAGAVAVVLYQLVPLPYILIGNANLTYAFGQSAAVFASAAATIWLLGGRPWQAVGLFMLTSIAFLSHVGIFPLLFMTFLFLALLCWVVGGPGQRAAARFIVLAATLAAVFSIALYYGQFTEAYSTLERVRGRAISSAPPAPSSDTASTPAPVGSSSGPSLLRRALRAARFLPQDAGWAVIVLALAGAWRGWASGARDRLHLWLCAATLAYVAFLTASVLAPVEPRFQRYTDEYISRLDFATLPAVVILAGCGAAWAWRAGIVMRVAAAVLLGAAALSGVQQWARWLA